VCSILIISSVVRTLRAVVVTSVAILSEFAAGAPGQIESGSSRSIQPSGESLRSRKPKRL
jgi:hypothetical protein